MKKKTTMAIFFAILLVISVFAAVPVMSFERRETDIVLIETGDYNKITNIEALGGKVIEVYDNHILVEVDLSVVPQIEKMGLMVDRLGHRTMIYVNDYVFDFTKGEPQMPEELTVDEYPPRVKGQYIVHMKGPVARNWRPTLESIGADALEGMGVEVLNYIPNYAYRVRMTPEMVERVSELYFVDWVGIYQPYYKLQPGLEPGIVDITLVPGASLESVSDLSGIAPVLAAQSSNQLKSVDSAQVISFAKLGDSGYLLTAFVGSQEALYDIARIPDVSYIYRYVEPELHGEVATQHIGGGSYFFDDEDDDPATPYRLHGDYGSYMNQIGYLGVGTITCVADTGIGDGTVGGGHVDFTGRVIGGYSYSGGWEDGHGHGSHCTGSIGADTYHGTNATYQGDYLAAQGSAPATEFYAVRIFDGGGSYIGPSDTYDIIEKGADGGAHVHSNSWGAALGGQYDARSSRYDEGVRDFDMVVTVSAGNSGSGATTIGAPATGKNVICVGSTLRYPSDPNTISSFSSRGWTTDNRVKPDVVAPGSSIYSTLPTGTGYQTMSGTSMSNPAVAGAAAVTIEWYEVNHIDNERPSPAMVKALLISTANELTSDNIPSPNQGWGMVDISKLERPFGNPVSFYLYDQESIFTESLQEEEHMVMVDRDDEPLKISLVWTDKEAGNVGSGRTLINDLNLEVESPGGLVYRGNAFSGGWSQEGADAMGDFDYSGDGWDDTNNVENVYIPTAEVEPGVYSVRVEARTIADDAVGVGYNSQNYALVAYNAMEEIPGEPPVVEVTRPIGGEVFTAGTNEDITWTATAGDDPIDFIHLSYSVDAGTSWTVIETGLPDTGTYSWAVPNVNSDQCLVRVRAVDEMGRSGQNVSDDVFEIIGIPPAPPENLLVEHSAFGPEDWYWRYSGDHRPIESDDAIGLNSADLWWGAIKVDLPEGFVTEIAYFDWGEAAYVKGLLYTDGGAAPDTLLGETEQHTDLGNMAWLEMPMVSDVFVTEGTYWIILEINDLGGGYFPFGCMSPMNTDAGLITLDSIMGPYEPMTNYGLDYSWTLEVKVQTGAEGDDDNLITWNPSPDETLGEVDNYNLYRSELQSGPWDGSTLIDSIPADGSTDYSYYDLGRGMLDDIYWWYVVRAVGTNGMEEDNEDAKQEPGEGVPPSITVTAPVSGDEWQAGTQEDIQWTTAPGDDPVDYINLWYSSDAGVSWTVIDTGFNDTGSYTWTVPNVHTSEAMIRARAVDEVGRWSENTSELFDIIGIPPAPAENLDVVHTGAPEEFFAFEVFPGDDSMWFEPDDPGTINYIAPNEAGNFIGGATWVQGTWYGSQYNGGLWTIDHTDGSMTYVGATPSFNGLAYDDSTDTMYGATGDTLYTVDPSDGSSTIVGGFGIAYSMIGIACDGNGNMYGTTVDFSANSDLYSIDMDTGEATSIGDTGMQLLYAQDMAYDTSTGTLYQAAYFGDGTPSGLYIINTATAESTHVGDFPGGIEVAGFAIPVGGGEDDDHNLITWELSPDETLGEVDHYNLYRSEFFSGPWDGSTLIDSFPADGSSEYSFLDLGRGMLDDIYWWYVVRAVGTNGFEEMNTNAVQEPGAPVTYEFNVTVDDIIAGEYPTIVISDATDEGVPLDGVYSVDIHIDGNDITADLTFDDGYAVYAWAALELTTADDYTAYVTIGGVTRSDDFVVHPGEASILNIDPESSTITAGDTQTYTAIAEDEYGNVIGDVTADTVWSIEEEAGGSWMDNVYSSEFADVWTVTGEYEEVNGTAILTVEAGAAVGFVIHPRTSEISAGDTQAYTGSTADEFGNPIDDVTVDTVWSIEAEAGGSWADNVYTSEIADEWTVTGEYGALTSDATLTVVPGGVHTVTITPSTPQTVEAGEDLEFTAEALDVYGNLITDTVTDFAWQNANANGVFNQETADGYQVTATYDGESSDPTTVTVVPAGVATVTISPSTLQTVNAGADLVFSAEARDEYGNLITDTVTDFTWLNTDVNGVFNQETADEYEVTATYEGVTSDPTTVNVVPASVASVTISPSTPQTVDKGEDLIFSAEARDEYGNLITDTVTDFTWQNADANGVFNKDSAGDYEVTATYNGVTSDPTVVTIESDSLEELLFGDLCWILLLLLLLILVIIIVIIVKKRKKAEPPAPEEPGAMPEDTPPPMEDTPPPMEDTPPPMEEPGTISEDTPPPPPPE